MMHVGDIMSIVGVISTMGDIIFGNLSTVGISRYMWGHITSALGEGAVP